MTTIYDYLLEVLKEHNKTINDIDWIGCTEFKIDKKKFLEYIKSCEYNEISLNLPYDLIIVGKDFWLEQTEDFGIEIFKYYTLPSEPKRTENLLCFSDLEIDIEYEKKSLDVNNPKGKKLYYKLAGERATLKTLLEYTKYKKQQIYKTTSQENNEVIYVDPEKEYLNLNDSYIKETIIPFHINNSDK